MAQRIKGQEAVISFTDPDGDVDELGDIRSFEAEIDMEILEEHYLGQVAASYDDIYNGAGGTLEMHIQTTRWFEFSEKIQQRAQRRTAAGGSFSITAAFQFPSGARARLTFEDVFWGPLPINSPGRKEYITTTLTWKGGNLSRVF